MVESAKSMLAEEKYNKMNVEFVPYVYDSVLLSLI